MSDNGKLVNYKVQDGIAILEMTDPPANTYTHEMMRDMDECILKARFDDNVHVIVIRGAGEKFFCIGGRKGPFDDFPVDVDQRIKGPVQTLLGVPGRLFFRLNHFSQHPAVSCTPRPRRQKPRR